MHRSCEEGREDKQPAGFSYRRQIESLGKCTSTSFKCIHYIAIIQLFHQVGIREMGLPSVNVKIRRSKPSSACRIFSGKSSSDLLIAKSSSRS
jgi:hypothetical protein